MSEAKRTFRLALFREGFFFPGAATKREDEDENELSPVFFFCADASLTGPVPSLAVSSKKKRSFTRPQTNAVPLAVPRTQYNSVDTHCNST